MKGFWIQDQVFMNDDHQILFFCAKHHNRENTLVSYLSICFFFWVPKISWRTV